MRYGLAAAALWSTLGIACEEQNTAIVVTVSADEALGVDQILLSASLRDEPGAPVFSRSSPEAPGPVLTRRVFTIVDDGDLVGRTMDFQVVGLSASSAQAVTQVSATFRRDEIVRITATLGGLDGVCGDDACDIADCERCPEDCDPSICEQCHDECEVGDAMTPACNLCVREVCDQMPSCCEDQWHPECADLAGEVCGSSCNRQSDCGNDSCEPDEDSESCPEDCMEGCGDAACDDMRGEDCTTCPTDCGPCGETCGNAICDPDECQSCPQDCRDEGCPCHHDVCTEDSALPYGCDESPCVRRVCDDQPSCCIDDWGPECADMARMLCSPDEAAAECLCGDGFCGEAESCETCETDCGKCTPCGDGFCDVGAGECGCPADCLGNPACDCEHGVCDGDGAPLAAACDPIVACVCETFPECCEERWFPHCANEANACGAGCPECGDGTCDGPIASEDCVTCTADCGDCPAPVDCGDGTCDPSVGECSNCAADCLEHPLCPCAHDQCLEGGPLVAQCSDCATAVCDTFPFCCEEEWTFFCTNRAAEVCAGSCPSCGDGTCDGLAFGEDCLSCGADCGLCPDCGDGFCDGSISETCTTCEPDCGACVCGNGTCDPGEGCDSCPGDCVPEGFDDPIGVPCGGECYECPGDSPWFCGPCFECGDGFCDLQETCFGCPEDCGLCDECGNDTCDIGETCWNCPQDCGASCGPGECSACASPFSSPTCEPCGYCGDTSCDLARGETCGTCERDCGGCGCPHSPCTLGGPLDPTCDACTTAVCELDPVCCALGWDARCVGEAEALCGTCP